MSRCLSSRLSSQLTRHSPANTHSVLFPFLAPAVFAQSTRTVRTSAGIRRGKKERSESYGDGVGTGIDESRRSERRENGVQHEDEGPGGPGTKTENEGKFAGVSHGNSAMDRYPESSDRHPDIPAEWTQMQEFSIQRKDLLRDDRHRQIPGSSIDDAPTSPQSLYIPPQLFWRDEDDAPGLKQRYLSSLHLKEAEVEAIHVALDARKAKIKTEDMALDRCVGRYGLRMTTYLYPYIEPAVGAIGREAKKIEDEISLLAVEGEKYRYHRGAVRWLLSRGKRVEDVFQQAQFLPDPLAPGYFVEVLGYVAIHRRALRLAGVLLEALATRARSHELGAIFSFLVLERLAPGLDSVRSSNRPEVEKLSSIFGELLSRITVARSPGRRIVLSKEAIKTLINTAPTDSLSELYTNLVLAHGGDYKKGISVFDSLRIISRLCRPESGSPKWHEAFAVLQTLDGDRLLHQRHSRNIMYMVLQATLTSSTGDDPDNISKILTFIARNSPTNWSPDRVLLHHNMSQALATLDGTALKGHFEEFVASGKAPDMVTLNILHNYYKRVGDEGSRKAIIAEAFAITRPTVEFVTDMLHAMVLSREPFDSVFREYRQHFMTNDLAHFSITSHVGGILPVSEQEALGLYKPDHVTLAVMIQSFINSTHSILAIWHIYTSYQRLLTGRHSETRYHNIRSKLLKSGSYIPHIIMLALSRYRRGLPYVANILEDMLRPGAPIQADVYTWSIFLRSLTRHGKQTEAETVLQMMQQRSLTPNVVTWTTLLVGYVQSADHEAVERVLQRMIQNGVTPNTQTWAAVIRGCFMAEDGNGDWRAGDAFRRMLDMGIEPDEHVHKALEGLRNRDRFEAGLSGEALEADSVFEDGELSYPEVQVEPIVDTRSGRESGGLDLKGRLGIEEDPLAPRIRETQTEVVNEMLKAAEKELVVEEGEHDAWDEEARKQEEELRAELAKEQARIAEERRRETESMFEEGELTWAEAKPSAQNGAENGKEVAGEEGKGK